MTTRSNAPPELELQHPTDERSAFLVEVEALRASGKAELADKLERAYTASYTGRGAFTARTEPPPRTRQRRRR